MVGQIVRQILSTALTQNLDKGIVFLKILQKRSAVFKNGLKFNACRKQSAGVSMC